MDYRQLQQRVSKLEGENRQEVEKVIGIYIFLFFDMKRNTHVVNIYLFLLYINSSHHFGFGIHHATKGATVGEKQN